jgi:cysteine desulfurase
MDNHSTTRVDPRVLQVMLPFFDEKFGNAASVNHVYGWEAGEAVETARTQVGGLLNADPKAIAFTSGATESNNLALRGVLRSAAPGSHLIVTAAEHKAVLDTARALERDGFEVTVLPVDSFGSVSPQLVADAIRVGTVLVSVIYANNEVGTINPVPEIAKICRERGVFFHTDATQAVGRIPVDVRDAPIDLLSLSAHKLYGPKGVGALYVRRGEPRLRLEPLIYGGGHERRLRSGTLPVPLIVGFGTACELCRASLAGESSRLQTLRDRLWSGLSGKLNDVSLNGHPKSRLPGNANVSFRGVNSEALMVRLKDVVAVSSGSACTTADPEPSHVLLAMGIPSELIESTIRFGLGRFNTSDEVTTVVDAVSEAVARLREIVAH